MTLSAEELTEIGTLLAAPGAETGAFAQLRRLFPHLSWTRCDASDVVEAPYRTYGRFDIHLLNSTDHCTQITTDAEKATGIVLALRGARS